MRNISTPMLALIGAVTLLCACSSTAGTGSGPTDLSSSPASSTAASPSPSDSSSADTSADSSSSPADSGGATAAPTPTGTAVCTQAQLTATTGESSAGAGQYGVALVFTNHSASSCTVSGYPGVAGLDKTGTQIQQAVREPGLAKPTITLAPGASVSAIAGDSNPDNYANPSQCRLFPGGLAVTPPNTSTTVHLTDKADMLSGCNFHVTPVVSGTSGT